MKVSTTCACAGVLAIASALPCLAADNPWDGTWKLNEAKSKMTGTTFTISQLPNGMMHWANGGPVQYDFACDGKDYPVITGRTFACTKASETAFDTTAKMNGKVLSTSHRELSADGTTLTVKTIGTAPDGTAFTDNTVSVRIGSGSSLVGTWKSTKSSSNMPSVFIYTVNGTVLHVDMPKGKASFDNKLDGTPSPIIGPTIPPGVTTSTKLESPRKLTITDYLNGKPTHEGTQVLDAGGKVLTETSSVPGKKNEEEVFVYEKQ